MIRSAAVDFVELYRYGYSTNVIWRAWFQSRGHDAGFGLGLRVLRNILPHGYKRQEIWQMPQQTLDFLEKIMGVDTSTYPYEGIHDKLNLVESALTSPLFPPSEEVCVCVRFSCIPMPSPHA